MRLIACCLLFLIMQVHPGQAFDWNSLPLNNRDKIKPAQTKTFLDALIAEYQRVANLPPQQRPPLSSDKRQATLQRAAFAVILSEAERQNIPQNAGFLSVRFVVEQYVQDVLGQAPTTDPATRRQQSDDTQDYLFSVHAETDRIGEFSSLPTKPSPRGMIDIVAAQLAGTELTARSQATSPTGPPTFPRIETTQQYTQVLDQLIERYDREVAAAQHLDGYKSERSMGMSLFEQTSNAVNALPDAAKDSAKRANGLYDIANIPATAMPLGEFEDRRADEQEQVEQP